METLDIRVVRQARNCLLGLFEIADGLTRLLTLGFVDSRFAFTYLCKTEIWVLQKMRARTK